MGGTEEIAREWRQQVISRLTWRRCENQAGVIHAEPADGEAGGYFVEADGFTRRAYLKPVKAHPDARTHARAGREKIAADLAYELRLPVPPAVLTIREDAPSECEKTVVVTLVMFPRQWPWEQVRLSPPDDSPKGHALARVFAACAPMFAFDTWIAQTDHGDHPSNIIWGWEPGKPLESRMIFLDFANAMGFNMAWQNGAWGTVLPAPFPPLLLEHLDCQALSDSISRIAGLAPSVIEEVVRRIPEAHISAEDKNMLCEGLIGRRTLISKALAAHLN